MIPLWFKREIRIGMSGADVSVVRRKLGFTSDGPYDRSVQSMVVGLAKKNKIATDGEVNADVANELGPSADEQETPSWYQRDLKHFDMGDDVRALNRRLGLDPGDDRFREDTEAAIRRIQSERGLRVTGRVDADLARVIG